MANYRAALKDIVLGLDQSPEEASFLKEKRLIEARIRKEKKLFLDKMMGRVPDKDEIFTKIKVRDARFNIDSKDIDMKEDRSSSKKSPNSLSKDGIHEAKTTDNTPLSSKKNIKIGKKSSELSKTGDQTSTYDYLNLKDIDAVKDQELPPIIQDIPV